MLLLVERQTSGRLGGASDTPYVRSRRTNLEKEPWASAPDIEGKVEKAFLRPVLLGESILPYRLFQSFEGVVPSDPKGAILSAETAGNRGIPQLSSWLAKVERLWERLGKGSRSFEQQVNYIGQLAAQFPLRPLRVVYAKSGTHPAACVIRNDEAVIDHKLYWSAPKSEEEAYYLCAILNSEEARSRAEKYQSRGLFGTRDFDKVMFNLPIPLFDRKIKLHQRLAAAGAQAEATAALVELKEGEKFQRARKRIRDALIEDGIAGEIEKLVEKLLGPV